MITTRLGYLYSEISGNFLLAEAEMKSPFGSADVIQASKEAIDDIDTQALWCRIAEDTMSDFTSVYYQHVSTGALLTFVDDGKQDTDKKALLLRSNVADDPAKSQAWGAGMTSWSGGGSRHPDWEADAIQLRGRYYFLCLPEGEKSVYWKSVDNPEEISWDCGLYFSEKK